MYPYHCNSRTHSIVIASHDFQLQTDLNANWSKRLKGKNLTEKCTLNITLILLTVKMN